LEQVYTTVSPSVVNVQVLSYQGTALGSGFVWDAQGHIITNHHVVSGARKITVTFSDGTIADAKLVGSDPNSDLAVLQVDVPSGKLQPVQLADSSQVRVGQLAIAIGNPFGLQGTMTVGIISGLNRELPVGSQFSQNTTYTIPDIIQTDASINPGNSGGVLVDAQGRVIGVTSAIESPVNANAGIGFVIPSAIVQKVAPALIQYGHYDHPWLGINGTMLTPDLVQVMKLQPGQNGVLVVDVTPNSPAQKAGLHGSTHYSNLNGQSMRFGGDVIVAVDDQRVYSFGDLLAYFFNNTQAGQTVKLTVLRQGQQCTIDVTLGVLPTLPGQ